MEVVLLSFFKTTLTPYFRKFSLLKYESKPDENHFILIFSFNIFVHRQTSIQASSNPSSVVLRIIFFTWMRFNVAMDAFQLSTWFSFSIFLAGWRIHHAKERQDGRIPKTGLFLNLFSKLVSNFLSKTVQGECAGKMTLPGEFSYLLPTGFSSGTSVLLLVLLHMHL